MDIRSIFKLLLRPAPCRPSGKVSPFRSRFLALVAFLLFLPAGSRGDGSPLPLFSWPADCIPGMNCAGRQFRIGYPDITGTNRSFSCDQPGYRGHQGTDIIVGSVEQGVRVLAAADGTVRWTKDGLFDSCPNPQERECAPDMTTLLPLSGNQNAVLGFNAGNYIVLEHDFPSGRYLTLYAHLRIGTQKVKVGQRVARGTLLAEAGSSGNAMVPHLHFGVYRSAGNLFQPVDPWAGPCNATSPGLWDSDPPYQPLLDRFFHGDTTPPPTPRVP